MTSDNPESGIFSRLKNFLSRTPLKNSDTDIIDIRAFEKLDVPRRDMIKGVMGLSEQNAKDIMIPRVDIIAVDSQTELKPLVKTICDAGHSRVPVYEETIDNIIGILYVKDLLKLLTDRSRKKFYLKKILHDPYFVPETMPLDELMFEFKRKKLHIAIVVDEYGGIGGIVTLEDILEEIVGEIEDEFDTEELPDFIKTGNNTWEIDSRMPISDLNEKLDQDLSTEDFDTVGGLVFDLFGKIPQKDETVRHGHLSFKIKDIHGTVIERIIVTLSEPK